MSTGTVVVAGGGGFIGGHLVARFRERGLNVRSVDIKPLDEWLQSWDDVENLVLDLREKEACERACVGGHCSRGDSKSSSRRWQNRPSCWRRSA